MCDVLNGFPELDITRNAAELSANLFRFDSHQLATVEQGTRNIEKRKFDVFHYCCACCNNLDLESNDTDIGKIRQLHHQYCSVVANI